MDNGDALAGVAYGLFEIYLNSGLRACGPYLFERVENQEDFQEDFEEIFEKFQEDYPQLAGSLLDCFGSTANTYGMLCSGEGVIPSRTTQMYWIVQDAPGIRPVESDDEKMGKWLIFISSEEADKIWKKIRGATCAGTLGISAKASTAKENPESRDDRVVIFVYTSDWEDKKDVMRVREELHQLGVTWRIGYKRNIETYQGKYSENGKKVTYYSV